MTKDDQDKPSLLESALMLVGVLMIAAGVVVALGQSVPAGISMLVGSLGCFWMAKVLELLSGLRR